MLINTISRLRSGEIARDRIEEINLYARKIILEAVSR